MYQYVSLGGGESAVPSDYREVTLLWLHEKIVSFFYRTPNPTQPNHFYQTQPNQMMKNHYQFLVLRQPTRCRMIHPAAAAARRAACFSTSTGFDRYSNNKPFGARERFYFQVDVVPCAPPWEEKKETKYEVDNGIDTVDTGISAGVDQTDSASGVDRTTIRPPKSSLQLLLQPRIPVSMLISPETTQSSTPQSQSTPLPSNDIQQWFTVTLDGRTLKTPLGKILAIPNANLAHAVAAEWSTATSIQPSLMPFMTLCCTAIDQIARQPETYRQQIMRFLQTDTICYWADPTEDRVLFKKQQKAWKKLHNWIQQSFTKNLASIQSRTPAQAVGHPEGVIMAAQANGLPHPEPLVTACQNWIAHGFDAWHLAVFFRMACEAKSFFVAAALITGYFDPEHAIRAARVEEEFQIENWGFVEGQHDYDRINANVQITSAALMAQFLRNQPPSTTTTTVPSSSKEQ
jgi:ATP synthase F1 complex assembly factor 2